MRRGVRGTDVSSSSTNLTATVAGVAGLFVIVGAIWFGIGDTQSLPDVSVDLVDTPSSGTPLRVHVSGAVASPGVVELSADAIVADAVVAAGGATRAADLTAINLAARVRAGERIIVPETQPEGASSGQASESGIDLNLANAKELETLPGVGPVLAQRIVAFRTERGLFIAVEDLLDVPGIGEAKLAMMRDAIARP